MSEKTLKKKSNIKKVETATEATSTKKLDEKATKKVAAADVKDVKKPASAIASKTDAIAKKPLVDAAKKPVAAPKKIVAACKPGVDCKIPTVKKPDVKKVVANP